MEIITSIAQMQQRISQLHQNGKKIGFVPTMGALHQGHIALVKCCTQENDFIVSSIFVNPIQFNNPSDLEKYPRTFEKDKQMLEQAGCHLIFYPSVQEMYPVAETQVYDFGQLDKVMEGAFRPGHFNGVAIVVKKLFDIVQPHNAYFGEKDFQQLAIIKALVKQEELNVVIKACPIVREPDGLAMSSRNTRLSTGLRSQATVIYHSLLKAKELYQGNSSVEEIKRWVEEQFRNIPQVQLEYFEIADPQTLTSIGKNKPPGEVVACIAACFGEVRLIDNMIFKL
jgi:pantoate--beta-alanine ligase